MRHRTGRGRDGLSVGVARWRGQGEHVAVIAKLTLGWRVEQGTARCVLSEPTPVCEAQKSELEDGLLSRPDDFAFPKSACDVLVVGHAHASVPTNHIEASVSLTTSPQAEAPLAWRRAFSVRAAQPENAIPLSGPYFAHDEEAPGPRAVAEEQGHEDLDSIDRARWQTAALNQRIAPITRQTLAEGICVDLVGLSPGGHRCTFDLPLLVPRLFLERGVDDFVELALHCDTVLFDTDYTRIELAWRASIPATLRRADRIVAALDDAPEPSSLEAIQRRLPRGTVSFAIERPPHALGDPDELEMARHEALEHAAEPELSLDDFARINAELAEQRRPRADTLDAHELDERSWTIEERAWSHTLANDSAQGDGRLAVEMGALLAKHQAAMAGPDEPRPLETYLRTRDRILAGEAPEDVLADARISPAEWGRLERHWLDQAQSDERIARLIARR